MPRQNKLIWIFLSLLLTFFCGLCIVLLFKFNHAKQKLEDAAGIIESLGKAVFTIQTDIKDTLDIETSFRIPCSIPVQVQMLVMVNTPIQMDVPVKKELQIPFSMYINEIIPLDTFFRYPDGIMAKINDSIPIDSRLKIKFWPGMRIPFKTSGSIPMNQVLNIEPGGMRVVSEIPIRLNISDNIPVFLDFTLAVSDTLSMPMQINSRASISFYTDLPVQGRLPIHVMAPVEIDFSKTMLKERFDSLAFVLRNVL